MELSQQAAFLFLLAIPVACVAWTITHEELFREPREYCINKSKSCSTVLQRKFFYVFTCEYCFSHYVTLVLMLFTQFHLLFGDWRGLVIGFFSIVWVANIYMSLFGIIRTGLKKEKVEATIDEIKLKEMNKDT